MKKIKPLYLSIIPTLILFTACSSNEPKMKKENKEKISIYNIMGITEHKEKLIQFEIKKEPLLSQETATDIEYISYKNNYSNHTNDLINNIEWNAKSFLGTPYVWGATGPKTFDCSGFTKWVYRDIGITIPRVSKDQARMGEYVSYKNLKRGDMVFFDTKKHRSGKVTHVGIYLGAGNFIHASSAGKKVVIYNFNNKEFYKNRFLWGRRLVSNNAYFASK